MCVVSPRFPDVTFLFRLIIILPIVFDLCLYFASWVFWGHFLYFADVAGWGHHKMGPKNADKKGFFDSVTLDMLAPGLRRNPHPDHQFYGWYKL